MKEDTYETDIYKKSVMYMGCLVT